MRRARVLLADDHRIVAEGLKSILEPEFELVGIVEDGRTLVEAVEKLQPDVVVADVSMPLLNGIEAMRQFKKKYKNIAVVILTMHTDVMYAAEAFEAGASGYVLKHSASSELVTAVSNAYRGRTYITPLLAGSLLQFHKQKSQEPFDESTRLTGRQREVLQLIAEGHSVKEIASILGISPKTVEFHKYSMMESLGLKTSVELVRYAVKHGIVDK
ncbi:response regulator [Desulfomonile tiedjei]|uniref:Response regulator containing a CheY-like receiver domain and an HTH DNA-binding domain n=1 Tax=Desulfomonile tiedjei (strain ATCC 49306 / DSM 6799 / DCB-1) TaxID=706587 RepID=I4C5I8_DESTA|nr:response regulator transcription factor [Desulfomonile tiedjei]AFM24829.1 response regulator containing a CheY-like receiver domain and an HTH DNA-binding domain [Desulfomonile tiedjei DSM 6799]